jgi:hypothetical protein
MPNIFINTEDEFCIKLVIGSAKDDPNQVFVDIDAAAMKELYKDALDPDSVEEHVVWFRYPTFNDHTNIIDASVKIENEMYQVNPSALRFKRISQLVKRWTFKGPNGQAVAANADAVKRLHPLIASVLGSQLEGEMQKRGIL